MKYDPDKHHRRSIRLQEYNYTAPGAYFITLCTRQRQCLFGAIVNGEMQLNALGQMVNAYWQRLPSHFPHLTLDAFVVMPNHIHGILVLTNPGRGAALDEDLTVIPMPRPIPTHPNRAWHSGGEWWTKPKIICRMPRPYGHIW
ncbi:MAG: hypothetical protein KME16_15105 [Scytolyngbya sp. HA4215-MV1]|nr:hypothetical protein [Scytolyngbya sp. HA4215-MV1]